MSFSGDSPNIAQKVRERIASLDERVFDGLVMTGLPSVSRDMSVDEIDMYYDEIYYFSPDQYRYFLFCSFAPMLSDVEKAKSSLCVEALSQVPFWVENNPIDSAELSQDLGLISKVYSELWKHGVFRFSGRDLRVFSKMQGCWPRK